jgi:hypothetical protein
VSEESVKQLGELNPSLAVPSHGQPMRGEELTRHLDFLINQFDQIAVPEQERFVDK